MTSKREKRFACGEGGEAISIDPTFYPGEFSLSRQEHIGISWNHHALAHTEHVSLALYLFITNNRLPPTITFPDDSPYMPVYSYT